ncbi:MAG: tRNA (adenosine(37)-N6)-threonylcarbamoyltransferase complex ATPase subunit type 1 TsaE [Pseudomonadota bacterium]
MADPLAEIPCPTPEHTARLATALAPQLGPGDTLLLKGDIGAGKTHFARALIQSRLAAAGLFEDVPSPTFTLVQTYWDGTVEIWHADLYRLGAAPDLAELGLDAAFETAICLVEWPDLLGALAPPDALTIAFSQTGDTQRTLRLTGPDRWRPVIAPAQSKASVQRV